MYHGFNVAKNNNGMTSRLLFLLFLFLPTLSAEEVGLVIDQGKIGIGFEKNDTPLVDLHVKGNMNIDGSLIIKGVLDINNNELISTADTPSAPNKILTKSIADEQVDNEPIYGKLLQNLYLSWGGDSSADITSGGSADTISFDTKLYPRGSYSIVLTINIVYYGYHYGSNDIKLCANDTVLHKIGFSREKHDGPGHGYGASKSIVCYVDWDNEEDNQISFNIKNDFVAIYKAELLFFKLPDTN